MNGTDTYVTANELAMRWGVTPRTARNYTLAEEFPACLPLSSRALRWSLREVEAWEKARRAAISTRRRSVRPAATISELPPPFATRTYRPRKAAA